jgi:hypothetical protein
MKAESEYCWRFKYNPNQPRVPAGSSGGGRWVSGATGIRDSSQIKNISDLESFAATASASHEAGSLPTEQDGEPLYAHAVRWPSDLDKIEQEGFNPLEKFWASQGHVRDRGSGFVLFTSKEKPSKGVDFVEPGLAYPELIFHESVSPKNILKVVRYVRDTSGFGIREDQLARYALDNQGISETRIATLPGKYRQWFYFEGKS